MKKLTVVIVSYNVQDYLSQCLASLYRSLQGIDAEVWVVDNHSKDDTVRIVRDEWPAVRLVASLHNLGFARANNLAIKKSQSQYVLLLNPDTIVGEDAIRDVLQFMDAHADAGAAGVRMLQTDGTDAMESRRGIPDPLTSFYKMSGLCRRFPKNHRLAHYYMSYLSWDTPQEIEIVSGAFCMLRREALDQVGLLDKDFFMYGEDIDLSYRILKGGWHNYYVPAMILHYKGESTVKTSFRYVHVFYNAMLIFFRKHYRNMSFLLSVPIKTAIFGKAFITMIGVWIKKAKKNMGIFPKTDNEEIGSLQIFDAEKYTYAQMLEQMHASAHKKHIAVYYPEKQMVIAPKGIYKYVKDLSDFDDA